MKKIDVLSWGLKHIASNHNTIAATDYDGWGSMSVKGTSVPLLADVRMLCGDLGINSVDCYADDSWDVVVVDVEEFVYSGAADEEYVPTGHEMWKRCVVEIGSPIEVPVIEQKEVAVETETAFIPKVSTGNIYEDLPF